MQRSHRDAYGEVGQTVSDCMNWLLTALCTRSVGRYSTSLKTRVTTTIIVIANFNWFALNSVL